MLLKGREAALLKLLSEHFFHPEELIERNASDNLAKFSHLESKNVNNAKEVSEFIKRFGNTYNRPRLSLQSHLSLDPHIHVFLGKKLIA